MTYLDFRQRLDAVCNDATLGKGEKIAVLRQMEADARARQRATNENMPSLRPDDGEELKIMAPRLDLGAENTDPGAATL